MKPKQLLQQKKQPKYEYEKEDDVLNVWLSQEKVDYAEQEGDLIVHFAKTGKPVYMEILNASNFVKQASMGMPREVKEEIYSTV